VPGCERMQRFVQSVYIEFALKTERNRYVVVDSVRRETIQHEHPSLVRRSRGVCPFRARH